MSQSSHEQLQLHLGTELCAFQLDASSHRNSRRVSRLLRRSAAPVGSSIALGGGVQAANLVASSSRNAPRGGKLRCQRPAVFASCSMTQQLSQDGSQEGISGGRAVPLFMLASASESKPSADIALHAPTWRVALGNLAAGATSGCAVEAALYPIDTIKTRLQAMIGGGGLRALWQAGGGKGLYAGVWGNLAGVAPASAVFMACYEPAKKAVQARVGEDQQFLGPVVAGAAAGAASSLIRVPTEVIKQRLQTREFAGAVTAVRTILSREGLRGLYAGYGAFMLRDLPFDAIEFVTYEQLKRVGSAALKRDLNPAEQSLIGAFAGGFTGVITTPLDVLKTRLMVQGASGRYTSLWDASVTIARTEGLGAFWKGWQPRLMWISLGGFVFFPVLEYTKQLYAPKAVDWPAPTAVAAPLQGAAAAKPCCGGAAKKDK